MATKALLVLKCFAVGVSILVAWLGYIACSHLFFVTTPSGGRERYNGPQVLVCFGLGVLMAVITYFVVIYVARRNRDSGKI
jgi:hypothetical protein